MVNPQQLGDYELGLPLGKGSVGVVHAARHRTTGAEVAIKILTWRGAADPTFRAAFLAEARAAAALDHPRVVRLLDQGVVSPEDAQRTGLPAHAPFLVMERVRGRPVRPFIGEDGVAGLRQALMDLLAALSHVHARGLVHRDIKAGNLLVDAVSGRAQLTDFSIVQHLDPDGLQRFEGMRAGTPEFMAPEQARGETRALGPWTDLYAVGCLAWNLCTGKPPFTAPDPKEVIRRQLAEEPPPFQPHLPLPPGFEGWLRRLLRKNPARRFALAADAAWALERVFEGDPTPPPGRAPPIPASWQDAANSPHPWRWSAGTGLALYGLRETPFVGREAERDQLWALLRRVCAESTPRAVVLRGPSGCGKTRLATWLLRRAEELGAARSLRARHSPDGGPQDGLRGALAEHLRVHGLAPERVLEHVSRNLRGEGATRRDEWEATAALLAPDAHPEGANAPREQQWLLLHRTLRRLSRGRAALLLLDDAQWSVESLALCTWLLHRAPPLPLLIVLTVEEQAAEQRPAEAAAITRLLRSPHCEDMPTGPLGDAAHHALVRQLVHLEPALARAVGRSTRGFPLFAVQLVGEWIEQGLLRSGPRGLVLPPGVVPALPESVRAVWTERLRRAMAPLSEEDQRALLLASVLGLYVDGGEWLDAAGALGVTPSPAALEALYTHALAEPSPGGWRWMHGMVRECARVSAGGWVPALHLACARMLERRVGPGVPHRRARHLISAGEPLEAIEPLHEAARDLLDQKQPERAERLLQRAHQLSEGSLPALDPRRAATARLLADVALFSGRFEEVSLHLDEAEAIYGALGDVQGVLSVAEARRWALNARGRMEDAQAVLEAAERTLSAAPAPLLRGMLEMSWAGHTSACGDYEAAARHARIGLEALQGLPGETPARYRATLNARRAAALINLERTDEAEGPLEAYIRFWARRRFKAADGLTLLAELARVAGRLDEADRAFQQALDNAQELGMPAYNRALPAFNQGLIALDRGQHARADERFAFAEASFAEDQRSLLQGLSGLGRAASAAETGDWQAWSAHLDRAEAQIASQEASLPEVVKLLEQSMQAAHEAGRRSERERARLLALSQAQRLGDAAAVARLTEA